MKNQVLCVFVCDSVRACVRMCVWVCVCDSVGGVSECGGCVRMCVWVCVCDSVGACVRMCVWVSDSVRVCHSRGLHRDHFLVKREGEREV